MGATTAAARPTAPSRPRELRSLPRAGLREIAFGLGPLFRPGTHRSPLRALGDRFLIDRPGFPKSVISCSPHDAKAMFTDRDGALSFAEVLRRFTPHPVLFGRDSYIFLEGEEHLNERRKIAPPFHGQALRSYEQSMTEITLRRLEQWPVGRTVSFLELGHQLALDVMMSVIFGVTERERMARLERAMLAYCGVTESPGFLGIGMLSVLLGGRWLPLPRLGRAAAAVDAIVLEEIAERRRRPDMRSDDCLTMFLELGEAEEEPPSDAYLARSMRGLMLAGYETTAVTLGWLAELLAAHPAELDALSASIDRGEDAYLDAVIAEVMRLRPAVPATGRRALREYDLGGLRIPRGTMILISIMALHERADIYPEPLRFRPERFLDRRPGTYTWLPFGGGAHRCLGGSFALFEARVLMRTLLAHRRLRAGGQNRGRPTTTHPMLVPAGGARVVLEPR